LTWRPALAQARSTNVVLLRVTDDGSPPLPATQSCDVAVEPPAPPTLAAPVVAGNRFLLTLSGDVGLDYDILASANLLDGSLLSRTNFPLLPFGFTDPGAGSCNRRFYRIALGP